jgi:hypothetical protein
MDSPLRLQVENLKREIDYQHEAGNHKVANSLCEALAVEIQKIPRSWINLEH